MKKDQMVGSRLPPELMRDLDLIQSVEQTDRSAVVRKLLSRAAKEWKLEYYAKQYGEGRISTERAAYEAGVSVWEMMDYLSQKKIPAQYDLEDLEHDIKVIHSRLSKKPPAT